MEAVLQASRSLGSMDHQHMVSILVLMEAVLQVDSIEDVKYITSMFQSLF